jgi:TusA-related sulfurtransferase
VLPRRLLSSSISVGAFLVTLGFASVALADPIPDGAAPSVDAVAAPIAPVAAPIAPVIAAPAIVEPPAKVAAPGKVEPKITVEPKIKADLAAKADATSARGATGAKAGSRSRTAAREPQHCAPGHRATKASGGVCPDPDAVAGVPVKKIHSGPHLEVVARDLRLDDTSRERLERIAQRYFEATRRRLVVTGGTRTPERQAELMLEKLAHGEDIVALYENKAAATEIRNLYRDASGVRQPKKQLIHAMRDAITAQMDKGIYVSRHLKAGAADVRSRDLKAPQEAAFRHAVADEPGVILIDERGSAEPHLHLGL